MQLLDTDTDIGVLTKMSTMQQESLEKFSLIENICSDITEITNGTEECVRNQEVVKASQKNIDGDEQNAQHTVTRQEPILNEKKNDKYDDLREKCDKESAENKKNSELEDSHNIRIENKDKVQEKINDDKKKSDTIDEITLETVVNNVDNLTNNTDNKSETIIKTKEEYQQNYEIKQDKLDHKVLEDKIGAQDKVDSTITENKVEKQNNKKDIEMDVTYEENVEENNSLKEEKIGNEVKAKSEADVIIDEENEDDIEMDVSYEKQGAAVYSVTEDKIEEFEDKLKELSHTESEKQDKLIDNSKTDDKIEKGKDDIEMDVIYEEEDKVNNSPTKEKNEDEFKKNSKMDDEIQKQNEGDIVMDVTFEEDKVNYGYKENKIESENNEKREIDKNIEKQNEEDIEMGVTIEKQDGVINNVTEDTIIEIKDRYNIELTKENYKKDVSVKLKEIEDYKKNEIEENQNLIKMDVTEQDKVKYSVTKDKIEEEVKHNSEIKEKLDNLPSDNIENEDVPEELKVIELQNNEKIDLIEEQDKDTSDTVDNSNQNEEFSEMDITFEEKDKINNSVTKHTIEEKDSEIVVKLGKPHNEKSGKEDALEELKEIGNRDKHEERDIDSVKGDSIDLQVKDNSEMQGKHDELTKEKSVVQEELQEKGKANSVPSLTIEYQAEKESEINKDQHKVNRAVDEKLQKISVSDIKENPDEDNMIKRDQMCSEVENKIEEVQSVPISETKDIIAVQDAGSSNACKTKLENNQQAICVFSEKDRFGLTDRNSKDTTNDSSYDIAKNSADRCFKKIQEIDKCPNQSESNQEIVNKTNTDSDKVIADTVVKPELQDSVEENKTNNCINESEPIQEIVNKTNTDNDKIIVDTKVKPESHDSRDENNTNNCINESEPIQVIVNKTNTDDEELQDSLQENSTNNCIDESEPIQEIVNKTIIDNDKVIVDTEAQKEFQDRVEENNTNTINSYSETGVTEMDTDEIIDIADEKDDEINQGVSNIEKVPENIENIDITKEKSDWAINSTASDDIVLNDKLGTESFVQDANVQQINLKKSQAENVEERKKLMHISKLSNTLDILSDEEEDLLKDEPQKDVPGFDANQCTSINIDDDDDIMLIDDEPKSKDAKNKIEILPKPESVVYPKDATKNESEDQEKQSTELFDSKKDAIPTEVTTPSVVGIKTSEPEQEVTAQEETSIQKKPLVQLNFLKSSLKNLADMTRDELEEFCILKIVESVVDRSNLSEIKSQLKTMDKDIEEYKKKVSIMAKQNRDLQVVIKSVQEEQKKKSNMPITPLKITRSVGMQVLMTDKKTVRKKIQNPNQNNATSNSGTNRQGKAAQNQTRLQKMLTNTNNSPPIPVPRLVPAVNNSNSNNVKTQSPNANTSGKSQVTGPITNSPMQTVTNGLPATQTAQKPEKRPHSRMQQSNPFTVDLTDDEPPAKVVSRNVTPPVRLVPPQNLLAPNRQPFGANMSNPRKVYIPISGSQTPVGVRPGQTIMLKTISPQGPRQRVPTPSTVKPNQNPTTVRMQRVPSRHPAPLPDSVKQYQPLNWKALPPAPELKLSKVENGIVISWKIDGYLEENYEEIASYQLYAYQETTSPPNSTLWKKIGDVKALPLPMACTLTQFMSGYKYYFAVRAIDVRSRFGPFSLPGSILLLNKM